MLYNRIENQFQNQYQFKSVNERGMDFDKVFNKIKDFMKSDPQAQYRLMIGTDSQVHKRHTTFATGIIIMREGKGAWGCINKMHIPRKFNNLKEKISYETSFTEGVAFTFTQELREELDAIVAPYRSKGASLSIEGHIDVGLEKRNKTRFLVREMQSRIESMGLKPVIKPNSLCTYFANKHTK